MGKEQIFLQGEVIVQNDKYVLDQFIREQLRSF